MQRLQILQQVLVLHKTMSEQGSVNTVFNSALSKMRAELLPSVIDNWFDLEEATQASLQSMGIFLVKSTYLWISQENATKL